MLLLFLLSAFLNIGSRNTGHAPGTWLPVSHTVYRVPVCENKMAVQLFSLGCITLLDPCAGAAAAAAVTVIHNSWKTL
jgi:hypothetical protein